MLQERLGTLLRKFLRLLFLPYSLSNRYLTLRRISRFGESLKGEVLEVGCGKWSKKSHFKHANVLSTDLTMQEGVDKVEDVTNLSFKTSTFDAILLLGVLEHVYEYQKAISEVTRVLKPGGILILEVPFCYPLHDLPHDYWRFSPNALERLFADNFDVLHKYETGLRPFILTIELWLVKKK